jgi:arylsulfatase A-like enzyme
MRNILPLPDRRSFSRTLALGAVGLRLVRPATALPNIVYVLADDLGWGDLGCYNPKSAVPTPHADHLAAQGIRFTDMHAPSAVCTPSRYGILTGRYCWRSRLKQGVLNGYDPNLIEEGRLTVPAMLKSRGYHTAGIGKWHLGLGDRPHTDYWQPLRPGPLDHGFDDYFGIPASLDMDPYLYFHNDRPVEMPTAQTPGSNTPRGVFWRAGARAPGFQLEQVLPTITDKAVASLRERARTPGQPFFLYVALTAPHTPWLPLPEFRGKSKAGDYGDFVAQVDRTFGRILQTLDETGLADNTLLIVTSDNGADWKVADKERFAHRANADWRGEKADIWDAGHRIPFLARWKGHIAPNTTSNELGCLTDLMGTVAEVVDYKLPNNAGEDTYSMLPAMMGKKGKPIREAVVHHSNMGMFGIRQGDWKLEFGLGSGGFSDPQTLEPKPGGPQGQLYNLATDPKEENNLWLDRPAEVARLTALLEKYKAEGHSRPM